MKYKNGEMFYPPDRGEVQEHHRQRWEPSFEEEDQWANAGKFGYTCIY